MSVTQSQLDDFHAFATKRLANGGADLSLDKLLWQWREIQEACEDIRRGCEEIEKGTTLPFDEVVAELRRKHRIGSDR